VRLALVAVLLGAPVVSASAAEAAPSPAVPVHRVVPLENPYCDYRSGYLCQSYGYSPYWVPGGWHHCHHHCRHRRY